MGKKIAWIGLGNMGAPMVENLAMGNEEVVAYNRTPKTYDKIGQAVIRQNISDVVDGAEVVFIMVADGGAVRDILFDSLGVAKLVAHGTLIVNMSTIGVEETKEIGAKLKAEGLRFMDAPVSGSVQPAKEGNLVILAGGDEDDFHFVQPLFSRMGKQVFHLGSVSSGATMKLLMNSFLGLLMESAAECMAIADKTGLSRESFLEVLATTGMWAPILKLKQRAWADRQFEPAFALKHMSKDLQLATNLAQNESVPMPAVMSAMAMFMAARDEGYGEQDMAAISEYILELAKI